MVATAEAHTKSHRFNDHESAIVRFAGDSGDGMQLVGGQFTNVSAIFGNDVSTFPDFPAEIRAPAGTLAGVSGFQVHFSSHDIKTPGDVLDTLVAMNPAALKTNLKSLRSGGSLIVNSDAFGFSDLKKAGYTANPLDDNSLVGYDLIKVPMTKLTQDAVGTTLASKKEVERCKNFFALGLICYAYDRPLEPTYKWIDEKFGKKKDVAAANKLALDAGFNLGDTLELIPRVRVQPTHEIPSGRYRQITGNQAVAYGMATAAKLANAELFYASYPITPASDILHELSRLRSFGVKTFQAEDEIAAMGSAVGAAFAGALAATGTSGPGLALKAEAIGLAVMTELPVVIIDVQRGGPSTGLPTKTEQADLMQAMYGRNGECPLVVLAASTPGDCFTMIQEAFRLAVGHMTPVIFLSDGFLANGAEPWLIPDVDKLHRIVIRHQTEPNVLNGKNGANGHGGKQSAEGEAERNQHYLPYLRDERLVRPWAKPGTVGLEHRIGGLEKEDGTGAISYDAENHQKMVKIRQAKVDAIADDVPEQTVAGPAKGKLLVVSWGGTYGTVSTAVAKSQAAGKSVAHCHIRYLNPFPRNLANILKNYDRVIVPELNNGQLSFILRGKFLVDAVGVNKIKGQPFLVSEIVDAIDKALAS